jgi:predicted flap endonuclease-1-like 5' DNA nuclease
MTWKRALLLAGVALLLWLRPWRRLQLGTAPGSAGWLASPSTELLPVPSSAVAPVTGPESAQITPEEAFGAVHVDALADFELPADEDPVAAFGTELDAALDLAPEQPPALSLGPDTAGPNLADVLAPEPAANVLADSEAELDLDALDAALDLVEEELESSPAPVALAETNRSDDKPKADETVEEATLTDQAAPADAERSGAQQEPGEGGAPADADDLLIIDGIGPRVSTIVSAAGITSFAELAATSPDRLKQILVDAGVKTIDPTNWPEQARIADEGGEEALREHLRRQREERAS